MGKGAEKYSRRGVRTSYISTVVGISLVLFVIGLVLGGVLGLDRVQKQAKENLQGDIFFQPNQSEADIKQIEQKLKTWPDFSEVYFVSPDRAIEIFRDEGEKADEIMSIFEGDSPLPPSITFKPNANNATLSGMEALVVKIKGEFSKEVDEVTFDRASVQSVNLGFRQFVFLFLIVALLLIVVAVAMINNTIRLALYSKRFTIKTMQLVGATGKFIRGPFLRQSIFQGIVSAILGMALLVTLFYALNNYLETIEISFDPMTFALIFVSLVLIGVIITFVSTYFALNKYLRMKLDDLY
jgi:cell division transport system permease protein